MGHTLLLPQELASSWDAFMHTLCELPWANMVLTETVTQRWVGPNPAINQPRARASVTQPRWAQQNTSAVHPAPVMQGDGRLLTRPGYCFQCWLRGRAGVKTHFKTKGRGLRVKHCTQQQRLGVLGHHPRHTHMHTKQQIQSKAGSLKG